MDQVLPLVCIYTNITSSSCRTICTDITDPFLPPFSIVHCFQRVFRATSCIGLELLYLGSCEVVHRSTSLMSSSLLLQLCPKCLVRLTWIVLVMGGKWPYGCCFVGCCLQDLYNITRSIIVLLPSSLISV